MAKKILRLPSISRVAAGSRAILELPIGPTYKRIVFVGAATSGLLAAHIGRIDVNANAKTIQTFKNYQRVADLNAFYGRSPDTISGTAVEFALHFERAELHSLADRRGPGIGTADLATFTVEVELAAGLPASFGSSPQVRGTLPRATWRRWRSRFIPAGAGNTATADGRVTPQTVHPRRCGEHSRRRLQIRTQLGSSPQVRGTLQARITYRIANRFIPAGAGNTAQAPAAWSRHPVHPRRCGEHMHGLLFISHTVGSSPQVRGTRFLRPRPPAFDRFIPAGAGNTSCFRFRARQLPVHPRRCGEHRRRSETIAAFAGSSPQVRGTPQQKHRQQ